MQHLYTVGARHGPEQRLWAAPALTIITDITNDIRKSGHDPMTIDHHRRYLASRDARELFTLGGIEWSHTVAARVLAVAVGGGAGLVDPRTGRAMKVRIREASGQHERACQIGNRPARVFRCPLSCAGPIPRVGLS